VSRNTHGVRPLVCMCDILEAIHKVRTQLKEGEGIHLGPKA